ncbi:uncharacterized protein LOC111869523 isoform X2 [Cryptotermes secundus]|nr:uncharacterized protein LOC111869523 isoform X2 [Cryptotermes secundus]
MKFLDSRLFTYQALLPLGLINNFMEVGSPLSHDSDLHGLLGLVAILLASGCFMKFLDSRLFTYQALLPLGLQWIQTGQTNGRGGWAAHPRCHIRRNIQKRRC